VTTLPCEILRSENIEYLKRIVINDKSQGSSNCVFKVWLAIQHSLHYVFIANFGIKKIKIGEHLAKLQAKRLLVSCARHMFAVQCPA